MIRIYEYSTPDHGFVIIDGRDVSVPRFRKEREAHSLCLVHQVDGLVIVDHSAAADFSLELHCGNCSPDSVAEDAGACAVAFADLLGVKPFHTKEYTFEMNGDVHSAFIGSHLGECKEVGVDGGSPVHTLCLGPLE